MGARSAKYRLFATGFLLNFALRCLPVVWASPEVQWSYPLRLSDSLGSSYVNGINISARPCGGVYAVWARRFSGTIRGTDEVFFRQGDGYEWMPTEQVSGTLSPSGYPSVLCGPNGRPYVFWLEKDSPSEQTRKLTRWTRLVYSVRAPDGWSHPVAVKTSRIGEGLGPNRIPCLVGYENRIHLFWMVPPPPTIYHSVFAPSVHLLGPNTVTTPIAKGMMPAAAIGPDGRIHVVYVHGLPSSTGSAIAIQNYVFYTVSSDGGNAWSKPELVFKDPSRPAFFPQVAVAPDNTVHVVWLISKDTDLFAEDVLHTYTADGHVWAACESVASSLPSGKCFEPALAIDGAGTLHLILPWAEKFGSPNQRLYYASWNPSSRAWSEPDPIFPASNSPSLCIDRNGRLHLAWISYASGKLQVMYSFADGFQPQGQGGGVPLRISNAFPNPLTVATAVEYEVAYPAEVTVEVYNVRGRLVSKITTSSVSRGTHTVRISLRDEPPGVYICAIETSGFRAAVKLVKLPR